MTDSQTANAPPPGLTPYHVSVPDAVLSDLQQRLDRTRWPQVEPQAPPWRLGTPLEYARRIIEHWRDRYDWRVWEARLNALPQYTARVGDLDIHLVVEQGSGPAPLPLILTHGWPGSFIEFLEVIDPLAHPERHGGRVEDAFTVVVPSLPGYGFSQAPAAPIGPRDVAALWAELMTKTLGFERYGAQGGDWGSSVTSWLALDHPQGLKGVHLNMASLRPWLGEGSRPLDSEEHAWREAAKAHQAGEMAYQQIQGTKPQTLAYGLTDSPAGLATWILEKFHSWTVGADLKDPPFDVDHLLTNVMIYWLGGINAANWMYCSIFDPAAPRLSKGQKVEVPTGMILFEKDIAVPAPRQWLERTYNLVRHSVVAEGGHFAAMENGPILVRDIREFFRPYR